MNDSKPLKQQTDCLSSTDELTHVFGKGFGATIFYNTRRFYPAFTIQETVSLKLSWYHCKDFWCDPYSFNFLNRTGKHLPKANLNKERMKRQAQLKVNTNGGHHD